MKKDELIFSPAIIDAIKTTADGGLRFSFDVDASQTENIAVLMLLRRDNRPVTLVVRPE